MAINFTTELEECGCGLSREDFYDEVITLRTGMFPAWTEDELACHPKDALDFCNAVRQRVGAPVPDHVIMHAMFNARKRTE